MAPPQTGRLALLAAALLAAGCGSPRWPPERLAQARGATGLHAAAATGDRDAVEAALEATPIDARDPFDWTALHWAAATGQTDTIALLAERGAEVDARAWYDMTPLHWAALRGHAAAVEQLLAAGADPGARNIYGMTPLHEASTRKVIMLLLTAGARVDAPDNRGMTPLHLARTEEVARALVDAGANVVTRARDGRRPIDMVSAAADDAPALVAYPSQPFVRLRGAQTELSLLVRNISAHDLEGLRVRTQSAAAMSAPSPPALKTLHPGQLRAFDITFARRPEAAPGTHELVVRVVDAGDVELVRAYLRIDSRTEITPEDRGMMRVGRVDARPAAGPLQYLAYASAPLLLLAIWLLRRWRRRRREGLAGGTPS